jgi:hypothetical protein
MATGAGQTLGPAAAEFGPKPRHRAIRHRGPDAIFHVPDRVRPTSRRPLRYRPGPARTLPGLACHPAPWPQHERGRHHRAGSLLPGDPPTRLGRQPANHGGVLPRRHAASPAQSHPPRGRARHGPGRSTGQPRPLAHPRGPADHHHLDPMRATRHRCLHIALRLSAPRRAAGRLSAIFQ